MSAFIVSNVKTSGDEEDVEEGEVSKESGDDVVDELAVREDGDKIAEGEMRNTLSEREGVVTSSRRLVSASLAWKDVLRSTHW